MNDDLISRQAVDDAIYDYSRSCDVNYAQIMEYIDKLPSVNPQPCEDSNANQHNSNALNALKGDAISRQKVLDVINLNWEYRRNCIRAIEKLPPVNPQEPKTGHWINGNDKCPCCGKSKFEGLYADIWADWQPKHCPNCGARIYKPQERSEWYGKVQG